MVTTANPSLHPIPPPSLSPPSASTSSPFLSAINDLDAGPRLSHLSGARMYLNIPSVKMDRGESSGSGSGSGGEGSGSSAMGGIAMGRNRSATVSDPAEIRATSPHLRTTFDRERIEGTRRFVNLGEDALGDDAGRYDRRGSTNSDVDPALYPSTTPQPLPSPLPSESPNIDPIHRSTHLPHPHNPQSRSNPNLTANTGSGSGGSSQFGLSRAPSLRQNNRNPPPSHINTTIKEEDASSILSSPVRAISPTPTPTVSRKNTLSDGSTNSSKTSAFFATSFKFELPSPPRPLRSPAPASGQSPSESTTRTPSVAILHTADSRAGDDPDSTPTSPVDHYDDRTPTMSNHSSNSRFPVLSTSRSAQFFLPSERSKDQSSSNAQLGRAKSLNSARYGAAAAGSGAGHVHGAGDGNGKADEEGSRSSVFFSTSYATSPPPRLRGQMGGGNEKRRDVSPVGRENDGGMQRTGYSIDVAGGSFVSGIVPPTSPPAAVTPQPSNQTLDPNAAIGKGHSPAVLARRPSRKLGLETPRAVTMPLVVGPTSATCLNPETPVQANTEERQTAGLVKGLPVSPSHTSPPKSGVPSGLLTTPQKAGLAGNSLQPEGAGSSVPQNALSPPSRLKREVSNTGGAGVSLNGIAAEGAEDGKLIKEGDLLVETIEDDGAATGSNWGGKRFWRLKQALGEGAFSVVWSAVNAEPMRTGGQDGQTVAIKMMDKRMCRENDRTRISFVREVAVLRHLSQPHIVTYHSSFSTSFYHCLVLEHVSGGELFDLLQRSGNRRRMGEDFLRRVFGELARGVGWLHEAGVVHRDLKLENIMFTVNPFTLADQADANAKIPVDKLPTPLVKLTDFGLARFIDFSEPLLQTRCGSESFAAPEIIMGKPYDGRDTDSWATGVILFALVTGELPFDRSSTGTPSGRTDEETERRKRMMRIAKGQYSWPEAVGSEGVRKIVSKLLVRDPARRTRVGPALWEEIWMHGPGGVAAPQKRMPGDTDEVLPDGRRRILDGYILHQEIDAVASRDIV